MASEETSNSRENLEKNLKRYQKTQETLRKIKFSKIAKALPMKDYLSDEKFKSTLTPQQEQSLQTLDAAEREALLKVDVYQLLSDARNELLEAKEYWEYKAKLSAEMEEASHRATTEYIEDRCKVDDLTLMALDAAYYMTLAEDGVDPSCYISLM